MRDLFRLIVWMVADLFRSRTALEVEIWMLRQQINVLRRTAPKKQSFSSTDRLIFVCLYRLLPGVRDALAIIKPETVVKWHRAGFRLYWRWKSKARGGRPTVPLETLGFHVADHGLDWGSPPTPIHMNGFTGRSMLNLSCLRKLRARVFNRRAGSLRLRPTYRSAGSPCRRQIGRG